MKTINKYPFGGLSVSAKLRQIIALTGTLPLAFTAQAATFDLSDSISLDWDSTLTYGAQFRVQGPQKDLTQGDNGATGGLDDLGGVIDNAFLINGNDGNQNFDTGIVSNRVSILTEADFKFNDFGFFMRAKAWLDPVYANQSTDNDDYDTYNPNPKFGNNGGHSAGVHEFTSRTEEYMGFNGRFLDAFVYGTFYMGDHSLNMRVGRQVISWGEAMLSGGGLGTAINHVDAQIVNTPGLEIKELFLPNGSVYGQFDISEKINVEAYYQYEWQPAHLDPSGSYNSEFDSIGDGGETFTFLSGSEDSVFGIDLTNGGNCTQKQKDDKKCSAEILKYLPGQPGDDSRALVSNLYDTIKPSDQGQFGVAGRYLFDNGAELGLYFVNYHAKIPSFLLPLNSIDANQTREVLEALMNLGTGLKRGDEGFKEFRGAQDLGSNLNDEQLGELLGLIALATEVPVDVKTGEILNPNGEGNYALDYSIKYFENIRMYGVSYSTVIGTTNVAAELTYQPNTPVMGASVNRWPRREDYTQLNANILHIFGPSWYADSSVMIAEVVGWHIPGRENYGGPEDYSNPRALAVQNTAQGWGYSVLWNLDYKNVIQGVDLIVPIYLNHGVSGAMFTSGFRNKQLTFSIGVTARYLAALELGIAYGTKFGSKKDVFQRLTSDRDNISVNLKYGF